MLLYGKELLKLGYEEEEQRGAVQLRAQKEHYRTCCENVPREEPWYCVRKSGVAEKNVRVSQDMYEDSKAVVRCAVAVTGGGGIWTLTFVFAVLMDVLTDEIR